MIHILLIEDNAGERLLIQEAFQECDSECHVSVARNGEVAIAMLTESGEDHAPIRPDLIVLDVNLPLLNGHEVLRELKTRVDVRRIPIFVLTSSRAERDVASALDRNCNAYFRKPTSYDGYVQVIRVITTFWRMAVWPEPQPLPSAGRLGDGRPKFALS